MRETKSQGDGFIYRHLTDNKIDALMILQKEYANINRVTWLDKVEDCNPKWTLTVKIPQQ